MSKSDSTAFARRGAAQASTKGNAVHDGRAVPGSPKPKVASTGTRIDIPSFSREHMVAEAAYFRAEHRGFTPGGEIQDWLDAAAEIDELLNH